MNNQERFHEYVEHKKPSNLKLLGGYVNNVIVFVGMNELATLTGMFGKQMLPWYIGAATLYITGRIADKVSTLEVLRAVKTAESVGIETYLVEDNPHLSARPSEKELLGPRKTSIDVFGLINSLVFPPYSVAIGGSSVYAAIHNHHLAQELKNRINKRT